MTTSACACWQLWGGFFFSINVHYIPKPLPPYVLACLHQHDQTDPSSLKIYECAHHDRIAHRNTAKAIANCSPIKTSVRSRDPPKTTRTDVHCRYLATCLPRSVMAFGIVRPLGMPLTRRETPWQISPLRNRTSQGSCRSSELQKT